MCTGRLPGTNFTYIYLESITLKNVQSGPFISALTICPDYNQLISSFFPDEFFVIINRVK
jgi:hypothetical protein